MSGFPWMQEYWNEFKDTMKKSKDLEYKLLDKWNDLCNEKINLKEVFIQKNLKKNGEEEEAKKFFLKAKSDIENPIIKPKDEQELKGIFKEIEKGTNFH